MASQRISNDPKLITLPKLADYANRLPNGDLRNKLAQAIMNIKARVGNVPTNDELALVKAVEDTLKIQ